MVYLTTVGSGSSSFFFFFFSQQRSPFLFSVPDARFSNVSNVGGYSLQPFPQRRTLEEMSLFVPSLLASCACLRLHWLRLNLNRVSASRINGMIDSGLSSFA